MMTSFQTSSTIFALTAPSMKASEEEEGEGWTTLPIRPPYHPSETLRRSVWNGYSSITFSFSPSGFGKWVECEIATILKAYCVLFQKRRNTSCRLYAAPRRNYILRILTRCYILLPDISRGHHSILIGVDRMRNAYSDSASVDLQKSVRFCKLIIERRETLCRCRCCHR